MSDNQTNSLGTVPNNSEPLRNVPHFTEGFRTIPNSAERKETHILTVREAARMFEAAGVTRTERSITNWCQKSRSGIARLDAFFDINERKYFITPQSVDAAIKEELAKAAKHAEPLDAFGSVPNQEERRKSDNTEDEMGNVKELEKKIFDLQVLNAGKDYFIDQLRKERTTYVEDLIEASRRVGELETQLLQLEAPQPEERPLPKRIHVVSEREHPPL
jgi:hypothetical protein